MLPIFCIAGTEQIVISVLVFIGTLATIILEYLRNKRQVITEKQKILEDAQTLLDEAHKNNDKSKLIDAFDKFKRL